MKRDVSTRADVEQVVNALYDSLLANEITAPKFAHLDIKTHLPTIYNFWCFLLQIETDKYSYKGGVFTPHIPLQLEEIHFEIWLGSLAKGLSEFEGPVAEGWMKKAQEQALFFQYKLGIKDFTIEVKKKD